MIIIMVHMMIIVMIIIVINIILAIISKLHPGDTPPELGAAREAENEISEMVCWLKRQDGKRET